MHSDVRHCSKHCNMCSVFWHSGVSMVLRRHTWPTVFVAPSMSLDVSVSIHLTWPRSSSHPRAVNVRRPCLSSGRTHQGPGTVCLRQSGPRHPYRCFVKNLSHSSALVTMDIIINLFHPWTFLWPSTHILLTIWSAPAAFSHSFTFIFSFLIIIIIIINNNRTLVE